jgi:divalent metal cation (Fe/Co/Zn/Cd) transporter
MISFAGLMLTALIQTVIVYYTNSVALLGDTLHNYADALTAVPLAIAFMVGRRLATRSYTYGRGGDSLHPGVVDVTDVRLRWHGHNLLAEARITVESTTSLVDAHHLCHRVEHALVHGVRRLSAATIHAEPLARDSADAHHLVSHHR